MRVRNARYNNHEEGVIQTTDKERTTELAATRNDQERCKAFTDASGLRVRAGLCRVMMMLQVTKQLQFCSRHA